MKWFFKDVRKACGKRWWNCSGSESDSRARWLGLTSQFRFSSVWLWVRGLTSLYFSLIHGNNNLEHGWLSCQSQRAWGGGDRAASIKWSWDAAAHSSRAGLATWSSRPTPKWSRSWVGEKYLENNMVAIIYKGLFGAFLWRPLSVFAYTCMYSDLLSACVTLFCAFKGCNEFHGLDTS